MTEEQRKEALVWYQRYFTQIYGGPIPDLPHHKTICAALQSQKGPVIDRLYEATSYIIGLVHAGSLNDAKEAIAAIYAAGMMIVSQDPHTKLERVDLDQFLLKSVNHYCDGNNRAISLIKAKYGELYAEVKE